MIWGFAKINKNKTSLQNAKFCSYHLHHLSMIIYKVQRLLEWKILSVWQVPQGLQFQTKCIWVSARAHVGPCDLNFVPYPWLQGYTQTLWRWPCAAHLQACWLCMRLEKYCTVYFPSLVLFLFSSCAKCSVFFFFLVFGYFCFKPYIQQTKVHFFMLSGDRNDIF